MQFNVRINDEIILLRKSISQDSQFILSFVTRDRDMGNSQTSSPCGDLDVTLSTSVTIFLILNPSLKVIFSLS